MYFPLGFSFVIDCHVCDVSHCSGDNMISVLCWILVRVSHVDVVQVGIFRVRFFFINGKGVDVHSCPSLFGTLTLPNFDFFLVNGLGLTHTVKKYRIMCCEALWTQNAWWCAK